jgi:phosphoglucomutase
MLTQIWHIGITSGYDGGISHVRGKPRRQQLQTISDKVGSYAPKRENFRLTPEVKQKFTEKLLQDPKEFHGRDVVRTNGLKLVFSDGS